MPQSLILALQTPRLLLLGGQTLLTREMDYLPPQDEADRGIHQIGSSPNISLWEGVISLDAQYLMYRAGSGASAALRYRRLAGDTSSRSFVATPEGEEAPRFSPNGRWVAYASDEAGAGLDVCVRDWTSRQRGVCWRATWSFAAALTFRRSEAIPTTT